MDDNAKVADSTAESAGHKRSVGESDEESFRDEESLGGLSEDDLDEFLKNGEHLSDQTLGDIRMYDCSLTTDADRSVSHHHTFPSESHLRNFCDLSCSMLVDGDKSLSISKTELQQAVKHFDEELQEKNEELRKKNEELRKKDEELQKQNKVVEQLYAALNEACEKQDDDASKTKDLTSQVSWLKENTGDLTGFSMCSCDDKNDENNRESFRLSSYVKTLETQIKSHETSDQDRENILVQTSSVPTENPQVPVSVKLHDKEFIRSLCHSFLFTTKSLKDELSVVRRLIKQPFENHADFPVQKIMHVLNEIRQMHDGEISTVQEQLASEAKHHHDIQNSLKDEIKTMKMRSQEKLRQKDHEIAELKARLLETNDPAEDAKENSTKTNVVSPTPLDDSFSSSNPDEETFSNLTRTKIEYLKLTPSEYVDDEVIDTVHMPEVVRQLLEDYKLKLFDMEKKFDANKRYLEEQTHDREVERDEFQHALGTVQTQIDELRKENAKLYEVNKQNLYQIEEYSVRLKSAEEDEMELVQKHEKTENELKSAVEKIFELREIIRDLEKQVDSLSGSAIQLKEQNQVLVDELEKQELMNKKEQPAFSEQDTYGAIPMDMTDEIQAQLQDLSKKIEFKLNEMDNFQWHSTRPNSSCSGVASAVSTEDVSCRELAGRSFENFPIEDFGSLLLNEIRRLESQFESLTRFEDVIMKKLKDTELRCSGQKAKIEELENQIAIYQDKCANQMIKVADLEGQIDALRFESSNQGVIENLKARLGTASKQLEEYKSVLANKEKEMSQVQAQFHALTVKQMEAKREHKDGSSQTIPMIENTLSFAEFSFEGVSPEKIRRMDTANPQDASVISVVKAKHLLQDQTIMSEFEPPVPAFDIQSRVGPNFSHSGGGDASTSNNERSGFSSHLGRFANSSGEIENENSPRPMNIEEMEKMFHDLQTDIVDKNTMIKELQDKLARKEAQLRDNKCFEGENGDNCEHENVTIVTEIANSRDDDYARSSSSRNNLRAVNTRRSPEGDDSVNKKILAVYYEISGDLMKYLGTNFLPKEQVRANLLQQGQGRLKETDRQIEIATLNTQLQQLKRALDEEKRKSEDLTKRLKTCEEAKAELRSRSPLMRAPAQQTSSSVSVQQFQQRETARQIEEGRLLLNEKQREIRDLVLRNQDLESQLKAKVTYSNELNNRLSSTAALLKKCEEHGRLLTTSNQENIKEIRRLKGQLDRVNVNTNSQSIENYQAMGSDHFDNFMRAKSHKKALAWQKKYLSSVILGYKSILRQIGHGNEHPDLVQSQVPLAPSAAGLLESRHPTTRFRVGAIAVIAVIRMKYMVNRWRRRLPGETSPDSEYRTSRQTGRIDSSIIRPSKAILITNRAQFHAPPRSTVDNIVNRGGSFGDISEYLTRFESLENEISSSLGRSTSRRKDE